MMASDAIQAIGLTQTAKILGYSKQRLAGRKDFALSHEASMAVTRVAALAAADANARLGALLAVAGGPPPHLP